MRCSSRSTRCRRLSSARRSLMVPMEFCARCRSWSALRARGGADWTRRTELRACRRWKKPTVTAKVDSRLCTMKLGGVRTACRTSSTICCLSSTGRRVHEAGLRESGWSSRSASEGGSWSRAGVSRAGDVVEAVVVMSRARCSVDEECRACVRTRREEGGGGDRDGGEGSERLEKARPRAGGQRRTETSCVVCAGLLCSK